MASKAVATLNNIQRSQARTAVNKLMNLGFSRFGVEELDAVLPAEPNSEVEVWRNIRYGKEGDRRLRTFQGPSYAQPQTDTLIPFGERLQVVEKKAQGDDLWLKLGNGTYANTWVLAKEGTTRNCICLNEWKDHAGRIPDSAFSGQQFPAVDAHTEGYDGLARNVCLVSASSDAFWREVNIEMLFRDLATATIFEQQWGDANFTDWVGHYSGNVLMFGQVGTPTPKRLVVTVKHTSHWKEYLRGHCRGPDVQAVKADIGKAQVKECEWLYSMRQHLKWEEIEFVTAFTFLTEYCGWNDDNCWQAAVHKLASLSDNWTQCMNYKKRAYLLESAIWCLDEALARQPAGTLLQAGESATILKMLTSLPRNYRTALMQKEPTDVMMRWMDVQESTWAFVAAEFGWLEVLRSLRSKGADLNVRDTSGCTPVHLAAKAGQVNVLRLLADNRNIYLQDDNGQTPAHAAAKCGQWDALQLLRQKDFLLERLHCAFGRMKDSQGMTAQEIVEDVMLKFRRHCECEADAKAIAAAETGDVVALRNLHHFHRHLKEKRRAQALARIAAANGHVEALQLLVELGLDVNAQDTGGHSLAHDAASSAQPEVLRILLSHGANANHEDRGSEMPAHRAARKGHVEALNVLADGGADLKARSGKGKTLVHLAAEGNHRAALRLLGQRGADVNLHDSKGNAPVHDAASKGLLEALEGLAEEGANLNARNREGKTPAHLAEEGNHKKALCLLTQKGADVNLHDDGGQGAVHLAAARGHVQALEGLVEGGADLDARDGEGKTPTCCAAEQNQAGALRLLARKGADLNLFDNSGNAAMHYAASKGHVQALEGLADRGADLNTRDGEGKTPACCAVECNQVEALLVLTHRGADPNVQGDSGEAAVHFAASKGHVEALEILADSGANLDACDGEGRTPAHWGAWEKQVKVLRLLAHRRADLNIQDDEGKTAAHYAAFWGCAEALGVLADSGADFNAHDRESKTPAHWAALEKEAESLRVLASKGADLKLKDDRGKTAKDIASIRGLRDVLRLL